MDVIKERHSVRQYTDKKIEAEKRKVLLNLCEECNEEGKLHMQIFFDEPKCFSGAMAKYGSFKNVNNYIALVGKRSSDLDERLGYYGEKLVLKAQELGLNTCWVALTHGKSMAKIESGERQVVVISLGYGENSGKERKSKSITDVSNYAPHMPKWFKDGVEAALLAPTGINQQKFFFTLSGETVTAKASLGFYTKMDLGIAKYHFEYASGHKVK